MVKKKENDQSVLPAQTECEVTKECCKENTNPNPPRIDLIQTLVYKKLTSYEHLAPGINDEIRTYIKSNNDRTQNPVNCRPITHLPTPYKIITL